MQFKFWILAVVLFGTSLQTSFASGGGSMDDSSMNGRSSMNTDPPRMPTPEEMAKNAYNSGVRYIDSAKGYEADAVKAAADEKKKNKALAKAHNSYEKALPEFKAALTHQPDMYQAWNYVGFCSRHLGAYDTALAAYGRALQLNPHYVEAIEYRGEAYLGLNRIEDAKTAYMSLFRDARDLSNQLLAAMRIWLDARHQDANGVAVADLDAFSSWLDERAQIAQQTASLAPDAPAREWK